MLNIRKRFALFLKSVYQMTRYEQVVEFCDIFGCCPFNWI